MKSVLMSVKPKWFELIANGKTTVEIRKTKPKLEPPFKCYIYCTKGDFSIYGDSKCYSTDYLGILKNGAMIEAFEKTSKLRRWNGKVIGEFICDEITEFESEFWDDETYERIQKIIKDCESYYEYGEYEYETVATNEDEEHEENWLCKQSCVSWEEMREYIGAGINEFYGWHISARKFYDKPKELNEFRKYVSFLDGESLAELEESGIANIRIKKAPQSWRYVEGVMKMSDTNLYIEQAKHAIGLGHKNPYHRHGKAFYKPYRNYFYTKKDNEIWTLLQNAGYAECSEEHNGCVCFYLTRDGLDWLGEELDIKIYNEER